MKGKQKRVLIALGWYDYRLVEGIARYAVEHGWHLSPDTTKEKVIPWGWEGDGILAWLGAGDDLAEFVVKTGKPTVDFSYRRPELGFPRVLSDHAAAARLVADHFLVRGFTHFIFYSAQDNWAFNEDGSAFMETLKKAGRDCAWIRWHESPAFTTGHLQWKDKRHWLATQLKHAPKPLAVFAATDDHALEVVETCEASGLAVPEAVSVIGMDDSLPAVEAMRTPVSSVNLNFEALGYRGARLLGELMHGKPPPLEPIRVSPLGLIARKSSDLIAVQHPGVARSLKFIWEHCHEPIGIEDLTKVSAMSRTRLHQAFVDHIGRSPGHEIHRVRIERAKRLLAEPQHKIDAIAEMCGYHSSNSFWVAFRNTTGMSPKEYRTAFVKPTERRARL